MTQVNKENWQVLSEGSANCNKTGFGFLALIVLALLLGWISLCRAEEKSLSVKVGDWQQEWALSYLKEKLKTVELTTFDPVYKQKMSFEGFDLAEFLRLLETEAKKNGAIWGEELVLTAADGFSPAMYLPDYRSESALLAFAEKGKNGGWSELATGKTKIIPAPFYIVWKNSKLDEGRYPRPYQLVKVEVISLKEKFPKIFPANETNAAVVRGFKVFKQNCLSCHSMNLEGGEVGPELNIPKNITEYRTTSQLKEFIRSAKSFRAKSKMPDFPQLTAQDLDGLMAYFKTMRRQKITQ